MKSSAQCPDGQKHETACGSGTVATSVVSNVILRGDGMLEKTVERHLVEGVKRLGGLCYKFTSPGTQGVPDRLIITAQGRVIFVELKTSKGALSKIQKYTIDQMQRRGADVRVLYGLEQVKELLAEIKLDNYKEVEAQ